MHSWCSIGGRKKSIWRGGEGTCLSGVRCQVETGEGKWLKRRNRKGGIITTCSAERSVIEKIKKRKKRGNILKTDAREEGDIAPKVGIKNARQVPSTVDRESTAP